MDLKIILTDLDKSLEGCLRGTQEVRLASKDNRKILKFKKTI